MNKYAIVVVGPSGAGKTTVADALIERLGDLEMSRSATTRQRRGDGRDDEYVYLTVEEFEESINKGEVLEYTNYSGNYYGTRKCELDRILAEGKKPILVLDYFGARSLKERLDYPVIAIYVYTTLAETKKRLTERDLRSSANEKKLDTLKKRICENVNDYLHLEEFSQLFDLYAENDELDRCICEIEKSLDLIKSGIAVMTPEEKDAITSAFKKEAEAFTSSIN
jgi:guanylate kinase